MAEQGLPKVKKSEGDETADNWLKGEATWPVSEIDPSVIDPDGLFLPKDPRSIAEEQQDRERGSKDLYQQKFKPPFGAIQNDWESNIDPRADEKDAKGPVSKHAAANRDHAKDGERNQGAKADITTDYMNKEPKEKLFSDEKKLTEMSIEELERLLEAEDIPVEADLLTNLPPLPEAPISNSDYNSEEDDEETEALDTFEHASHDPVPKEGPIETVLHTGAYHDQLQEAGGKGAFGQFFQENPNAFHEDPKNAFHRYKKWADKKGIEQGWWQTFQRAHAKGAGGSATATKAPRPGKAPPPDAAPPAPRPSIQSADLDSEFGDMLGPLAKATEEQLSSELTVDEKYSQLLSKVYDWATTPMEPFEKDPSKKTSGSKRHIMICGSAGVGKTFSVKEAVLRAVNEGIKFKTQYVRGTIGKSISNVMAFLYRFRQGYLIIFDDCDDFLDSDLGNVMKGVFELDAPTTNTGSVGVRKMAAKNMLDLEDQPLEESEAIRKFLRGEFLNEAADEDMPMDEVVDEADDEEEFERDGMDDTGNEDKAEELLPARINFQSRILFISNKKRTQIDAAVRSRLSVIELYLSAQEIIGRIREIFAQLLKNEATVPKARLEWAKTNALRWLELTVKANGQPIEFPGGRSLQLPFEPDATIIEFRTYIDLVSGWLSQSKKYEREHKGISLMTQPKLPMDFLRGFLMGELVPILKDATKGRR